jgi:hypothetical protein
MQILCKAVGKFRTILQERLLKGFGSWMLLGEVYDKLSQRFITKPKVVVQLRANL